MTIIERIISLAEEKGIKQNEIARAIGKGDTTCVTDWKKRNCNPPAEYIPVIAELLEVSIACLMTGKEQNGFSILSDEMKHLSAYRRLDSYDKKEIDVLILMKSERHKDIENK